MKRLLWLFPALAFASIGLFDDHSDVGDNPRRGDARYDPRLGAYEVTGGGANIWAGTDAFHFAWKRASGDFVFTADIQFLDDGAVAHRKAALMVRQSLDPDSAYADAALHGDGMTSLQFRPTRAALTQEIRSELVGPRRLSLERHGNEFTLLAGAPGEPLRPTPPATVVLQDPVYVGLAVCSHDANVLETAVFTTVTILPVPRTR